MRGGAGRGVGGGELFPNVFLEAGGILNTDAGEFPFWLDVDGMPLSGHMSQVMLTD